VGVRKLKAVINPKLHLIGLLPMMVEATPFQKANFLQLVQQYYPLLIRCGPGPGDFASMPRRSAIAEAQAAGEVLWEMKKTAARDAWRDIEPGLKAIADVVVPPVGQHQQPNGAWRRTGVGRAAVAADRVD
jgi:chromosome partitioning protein